MKKLLLLAMLLPTLVFGRKFYFSSSTGNNSNSVTQAQNSATPWATLTNLHKFANGSYPFGAAPNRAAAGDTFLFKCGDVFSTGFNNSNDDFGVVKWWNGVAGYTSPTGTANAPIVFTSYGTGDKPNFLFPNPTAVIGKNRNVLTFKNVGYIYFNNLQFNDTRFPVNDKVTTAYTAVGLFIGESNASICNNVKVTNCNFSNTAYGIRSCARIMEISNNTFTNFKSPGDTLGINDIGADALLPSGYRYLIKNNLIQGSWAYANPNSSSQGKLGGGLETINDFDSSLVIYNTFLDNSGAMEFGQNAGTQYGPNDDTFAFNKFINNSAISYVNVTGTFACTAKNLHFWNNVIIENGNSRQTGANFGQDVLGDGQSFTTWSFWPSYPLNPSVSNPTGWRPFQYASDAGVAADTLYDIRNNVIWNNNGLIMKYTSTARSKIKYSYNVYRLGGTSSLGAPLGTGEISTSNKVFIDTSSANPANWNLHLQSGSPAINAGVYVGVSPDWAGSVVTNPPSVGIYNSSSSPVVCTSFTYGAWSSCNNNQQTRTYTALPNGCVTAPPTDSIVRGCVIPTCSFTYGQWGTCVNSVQTRTYSTSPVGCISTPPADSIQRICPNVCSFIYSAWSTCKNGQQTRTYTSQPIGCIGVPVIDSVQRACGSVVISSFYYRASRTSIYIKSTKSGTMIVTNLLGQTVLVATYPAGGKWISVSSLAAGPYVASTYEKSITFTR